MMLKKPKPGALLVIGSLLVPNLSSGVLAAVLRTAVPKEG